MRTTIVLLGATMAGLLGCGADLTGEWEGTIDNDGNIFLDLKHDGDVVEGDCCETEGRDCNDIEDGEFTDDQLTFYIEFVEYGVTQRVSYELDISDDEEELQGELDSTKCNCRLDVELERQ